MKSETQEVNGIKTHFTITNPKAKKTLIFLHGWGGKVESFEKIAAQIPSDIQMICIDLPGFGKSDMPPIEGWTTHNYADWLHDFLEVFSTRHQPLAMSHFYGHSFGCRVLVRFAQKYPKRVDKLVLTGAAGIKWPPSAKQKILSTGAKIMKPLIKKEWSSGVGAKGKIKRKLLRFFGAHDWEECPVSLRPTLTQVLAEDDFREDLKQIPHKTLLLWGAKDTYTPLRSGKIYHEYLPDNKLVVFPEGRHGIHYTQAPEIVRLIHDFL